VKVHHAGAALAAALSLVLACSASAASPPAALAFAKELRSDIKPTFAEQAPGLVLGKVTCVLPSKGNVARCLAHFADKAARANVVYTIKATLKGHVIAWSASAHSCTSSTTGRKLAC